MKKITYLTLITFLVFLYSCEYDNYPEPKEILTGSIIDKATNQTVQTETGGSGGIRLTLLEYSWSDSPTPYYFYCKQDGTFSNTKIFAGNYNIVAEGAFVPLIQYVNGVKVVDNSQTVDIKGKLDMKFEVEPFLRIEWVGDPIVNNDSTITATVKITRGTTNADFHKNIKDVYLYVNSNQYSANNNFDGRYSTQVPFSGTNGNLILSQTYTIKTSGKLPPKRTYFLRVGSRIDYVVAGSLRYNYSEVKSVAVP